MRASWAICLLALGIAGTAMAQEGPRDPFGVMDQSGDNKVSREEFLNRMASMFHDLDKDNDRVLRGGENFPVYDSKGAPMAPRDVTVDEFVQASGQAFNMADQNADGFLTRDEAGAN